MLVAMAVDVNECLRGGGGFGNLVLLGDLPLDAVLGVHMARNGSPFKD